MRSDQWLVLRLANLDGTPLSNGILDASSPGPRQGLATGLCNSSEIVDKCVYMFDFGKRPFIKAATCRHSHVKLLCGCSAVVL